MIASSVLPEDFKMAKNLYECCYSFLNRAQLELNKDHIGEAERLVNEFQRCKKDLDKLIDKKKQHDKMHRLAADLKGNGIKIAVIKNSLLRTVSK
jgi:hypothetical protein